MTGRYEIHCLDALEFLQSSDEGSFDCVITDPPYNGFGFTGGPHQYRQKFEPFYNAMLRCLAGPDSSKRVSISQPPPNLEAMSQLISANKLVTLPDAFADGRGKPARFLVANPLLDQLPKPESWTDLPNSQHPNHRNVNKMAVLVKYLTRPGETILDPFCGSAAIGLAAILLARNYVGIEVDPARAAEAEERLGLVSTN